MKDFDHFPHVSVSLFNDEAPFFSVFCESEELWLWISEAADANLYKEAYLNWSDSLVLTGTRPPAVGAGGAHELMALLPG